MDHLAAFREKLDGITSIDELMAIQMDLDSRGAWLSISPDETLRYFSERGVTIDDPEDFPAYQDAVGERIEEVVDGDVPATQARYDLIKQATGLPARIESLDERATTTELESAFADAMRSTYHLVHGTSREFKDTGKLSDVDYNGKLTIKSSERAIRIGHAGPGEYEGSLFYLVPKVESLITETRKSGWRRVKTYVTGFEEGDLVVLPISLPGRYYRDNVGELNHYIRSNPTTDSEAVFTVSPEEYYSLVFEAAMEDPQERIPLATEWAKTMLQLPQIIENYVSRHEDNARQSIAAANQALSGVI